jgi:SAM-dependent methyltransferase
MKMKLLEFLVCASCAGSLGLRQVDAQPTLDGEIEQGELECAQCDATYPVVRFMPRFVPAENYAASFGFQWNKFPTLQVDTVMQNDLSRKRFYATTGWASRLPGDLILEAGCGSGRFTQLALETGAEVISFDLSSAVEAAYANNRTAPNLHMFQASIMDVPLRKGLFDKIFCMGVIQHCPDPKQAFRSLVPFLRPGGEIVVDVYEQRLFPPKLKYLVRPVTRRMSPEALYGVLNTAIPAAFDVKKAIHSVPGVGPKLARLIPIGPLSHTNIGLHYTEDELKQVKVLSAFDMLSPKYDSPQRIQDVRRWFEEAGLTEIETKFGYNGINAKGRKPLN